MATGMSDANNNIFCNRRTHSESDCSGNNPFELRDSIFAGFSESLKNSLLIANRNGDKISVDRQRSHTTRLSNEDNPLCNGLNTNNGWNSNDRWNLNNAYDSSNSWSDWSGIKDSTPECNTRSGMRAIRKQSESEVVYSTPPLEDNDVSPKDWYNTFVEQTQRFAKLNGKPSRNKRHVHFQDDHSNNGFDSSLDDSILNSSPSLDSSNASVNGFDIQNDMNGSIEDKNRDSDWKSSSDQNSNTIFTFPKTATKGSIMDSFCSGILKPVANNFHNESQYMAQQFNQNLSHFQNALNNSTIFGDSIWANPSNPSNSIYRIFNGTSEGGKSSLHKLLADARKAIPKNVSPNYTWSGQLPRRIRTKTPVYSCKVFLGGIPYDLTDSDLHCTFAQFGHIQIQWPGKDIRSAIEGAAANKAGYVYIIFETCDNVAALLNSCTMSYRDMESGSRWYYNISSRRQKSKEVQVIPFDIGDRFFMKSSFSGQMEHSRTVFVGGLHGMLAADGLAKVMDDLFGGVIFVGLDTDKHKYPLGSGRVTFDNLDSYLKALSAAFVEIKSARFKKKIQIDPYIESESMCVVCRASIQNPIYCREEGLYFCAQCWECQHSDPESANHRPIVKNKTSKA